MDVRCRIEPLGQLRVRQGERQITRLRSRETIVHPAPLAGHIRKAHPQRPLHPPSWLDSPPHLVYLNYGCCFTRTPANPHVADQVQDSSYGTGPRRE